MTYAALKALTSSLLIGDKKLPTDNQQLLPLVDYGMQKIATEADALRLMVKNKTFNTVRIASNGMYIRKAKAPTLDDEILDLDDELCYALANYIASFLSNKKPQYFVSEAKKIVDGYNSKIYDVINDVQYDEDRGVFIL